MLCIQNKIYVPNFRKIINELLIDCHYNFLNFFVPSMKWYSLFDSLEAQSYTTVSQNLIRNSY